MAKKIFKMLGAGDVYYDIVDVAYSAALSPEERVEEAISRGEAWGGALGRLLSRAVVEEQGLGYEACLRADRLG